MLSRLVHWTFASVFVAVLARLSPVAIGAGRRTPPLPEPLVAVLPPEPQPDAASAPAALVARKDSRLRRLLRAAFDVVLVLAVALTIFVAYGLIGNRWYHVVAIEGGSMEPAIMRGDLIVVSPAPAKIEPGMILVIGVEGRMVTHRVIEVHADGSLVTKGDANPIPDDWQGKPIQVFGEYQFAIPVLGRFLPVSNSGADFTAVATATQRVTVGSWGPPPPTPALRATVRIEPETIKVSKDRDRSQVSAFIKLPAPHKVGEIVRTSIKLCYRETCISNTGAKVDSKWLRASFATSDVIALVGKHRGQVTFTVQGAVAGYPAGFVGYDSIRIVSTWGAVVVGGHVDARSPTAVGR